MTNFGRNLTRLRNQKKLSQRQLAERLGVRQSHIGNIEAGSGSPSWEFAQKVAAFFSVTLDHLNAAPKEGPEPQKESYPEMEMA